MQSKTTLKITRGFFKRTIMAIAALCLFAGAINAQPYINGGLSTGATTSGGVAAPTGFTWSELQGTNTGLGQGANIAAGFTLADDFIVPTGSTWNITKITFYAYSTGYTGTTSPFNDTRVRIFNTNPSVGTPTAIYGNLTANVFAASSSASIYRIGNNTPGTTRQVWKIEATVATSLAAGTYWLEWQHGTIATVISNFSPTKTVVGQATQAGNNALQHDLTAGTWTPITDGTPAAAQDYPFQIDYTTACINATAPIVSASALNSCSGAPVTLSASGNLNNAANWSYYTGSCGGTLVGTGNSITVNPTVTTTYFVRGEGACTTPGDCGQVTVTVTPCTCLTPDVATICEGSIQRLSVSGAGTPATASVTSGTITLTITDNSPAGVSSIIPVSLPAGASITSMSASFDINHTWDSDLRINLVGPNGSSLNLVNSRGGSGNNFTNTIISSTSTTSLATGVAPFTGTFAPDAAIGVGPTGFLSNAPNFASLYSTPSGNWTLALRDGAAGDVGTLNSWSLTINYSILPTAIWTGGTIYSNAAATTPYVAGTQANAVWVKPITTTSYTANIASGPCAGDNVVTVTVLPRPVVVVNPASGCGPLTITASGASTYSWSPAAGLNTTSGATVIANPATTTTYTVIGTGTNGCSAVPVTALVNSAPTASVISAVASSTFQVNENFTGTVPPTGWLQQNLSSPIGTTTWFKPTSPAPFPAFSGTETAYAAANFNSGAGTATISNWLFSPVVNIKNGDMVSFYTRTTTGTFPDRLQLRLSTSGASVNAGTTSTSTGDFSTLLVDVNPNLTTTGYPVTWTKFTGTVSGVTGTVTGRFALRYFVTDGGTTGNNSDFIGVDDVTYETPSSVNCANVVTNIKVDITGGVAPYTLVYSNGTTNTTINNYVSGSNIQVSPAVTTNYTIVSVTGANGCLGSGNTGTATITITPAPSVTTPPANRIICEGNNTTFTVVAAPANGNTYQWQVSTDGGTTYVNLTNTGVYSGVTTTTLTITGATTTLSGNRYRVAIAGSCPSPVNSAAAVLTVNTTAVITTQPVNTTICAGGGLTATTASFSVAATGGGLTYQWQVSTDNGVTYTNITNNTNYAGATTSTLTLTNVPTTFSTNLYRVNVTSGGCTAVASSSASVAVRPTPVIVLGANSPFIYPGQTSTLSVAVSPNAAATYTWFRDGTAVVGATTNTLVVDVDKLGLYTVRVTDINGCTATSNAVRISGLASSILFIYPSPNTGQFQVRYFSPLGSSPYPRTLSVFDSKGARVYSRQYAITSAYTRLDVDLNNHPKGIYSVELTDSKGNRIKTGRVLVL